MSNAANTLLFVGSLVVVLVTGCRSPHRHESTWAHQLASNTAYDASESRSSYASPAVDEWVCPMHARVRQPEAGKCP